MNIFYYIKDYLRLWKAIEKADNEFRKKPNRYYVLPTKNGKLVICDRRNFRLLKKKHYIREEATIRDCLNECFYFTPYANGNGYITEESETIKRQQYFRWCQALRELAKKKKQEAKERAKRKKKGSH